jgi:hypothetical protein
MARIYVMRDAGQVTGIPVTALVLGVPTPPQPSVPPAIMVQQGIPGDVPQAGVPVTDIPGLPPPTGAEDTGPAKTGVPIAALLLLAAAIYFVAK